MSDQEPRETRDLAALLWTARCHAIDVSNPRALTDTPAHIRQQYHRMAEELAKLLPGLADAARLHAELTASEQRRTEAIDRLLDDLSRRRDDYQAMRDRAEKAEAKLSDRATAQDGGGHD